MPGGTIRAYLSRSVAYDSSECRGRASASAGGAYDDAMRAHRRLCNQLYYTLQQYYPTALKLFRPHSSLAFLE